MRTAEYLQRVQALKMGRIPGSERGEPNPDADLPHGHPSAGGAVPSGYETGELAAGKLGGHPRAIDLDGPLPAPRVPPREGTRCSTPSAAE